MPRVYSARGLGFALQSDTGTPDARNGIPEEVMPAGLAEQLSGFIEQHKTGVIAACAGLFVLALFGELGARR